MQLLLTEMLHLTEMLSVQSWNKVSVIITGRNVFVKKNILCIQTWTCIYHGKKAEMKHHKDYPTFVAITVDTDDFKHAPLLSAYFLLIKRMHTSCFCNSRLTTVLSFRSTLRRTRRLAVFCRLPMTSQEWARLDRRREILVLGCLPHTMPVDHVSTF